MKGRLWTSVYLAVLVWPVPGFLSRSPSAAEVGLVVVGLLLFAALYLRVVWTALARPHLNATPYALALMYAVAALLAVALGELWVFAASFFLITALAAALPRRPMLVGTVLTVGAVTLSLPLLGAPLADNWWIPLQVAVFAGAMRAFLELAAANRALSLANAEVERLAVDNERLRFARDMHDILGHSLAVMTLKSQLAGRLMTADPARAASEIGEVEELSRQALSDVRDAIAGYRQPSLPGELAAARRALAAAGIHLELSADPVPAEAEPVLAWVVREGTTNVVRHSGARRCHIRLGTSNGDAYIDITNDGPTPGLVTGSDPTPAADYRPAGGTGLRGLTERIELVGGTLHAAPAPTGGFRLHARLPLPPAPDASPPP